MNTELRGRGRPKGVDKVRVCGYVPKVNEEAAVRALKELGARDSLANAARVVFATKPAEPSLGVSVLVKPDPQVKALLDDVEKLTNEKADLASRLERCARATDDDKTRYWMNRALKAEQGLSKGEFDQT